VSGTSYLEAVALGVIQGLTEFLPVSSDGHLTLGSWLLGLEGPRLAFNVMLHSGTLLAVLLIFWRDLWGVMRGGVSGLWSVLRRQESAAEVWRASPSFRLAIWVVVATIPTGIIGLVLKPYIDPLTTPLVTGVCLILSGAALLFAKQRGETGRAAADLSFSQSLAIGVAQGLAVLPGLSRSGSTIAGGLFLGMERSAAARFSFLLSIPAVAGALLLEAKDLLTEPSAEELGPIVVGALTSLVVGLLALRLLLWVTRGGRLHWFAYYLFPLGGLVLLMGFLRG
jgi:undecaprenyl-diphosphatase